MRSVAVLLVALASFVVTPALAQVQSPNTNPNTVRNVGVGVANSSANSASRSAARSGSRSAVNIGGSTTRIAPTAIAPGLAAAGIETCLGSFSAGGSFVGGGISFGGTMRDAGCDTRLVARTLWSMGYRKGAVAVMCSYAEGNVNVRAALGPSVCPQPVYAQQQPFWQQQPYQQSYQQSSWQQNDANGNRARYGGSFEAEQRWMNRR